VVVSNQTIKCAVDVVGPRITTYVEGEPLDYWNDTRLRAGTFGFHERQGRARGDRVRARIQPGKRGWQLKPAIQSAGGEAGTGAVHEPIG